MSTDAVTPYACMHVCMLSNLFNVCIFTKLVVYKHVARDASIGLFHDYYFKCSHSYH